MKQYMTTLESPLNSSTAKQKYTIPRAERVGPGRKAYCYQSSYQLPQTLNQRQAGIGYGEKQCYQKSITQVPGPGSYEIKGATEQANELNKGPSFAVSRENMQLHGILGKLNTFSPSPDRYELPSTLKSNKFTFGLREQLLKEQKYPGPGAYEAVVATNKVGVYGISKFHNSGAAIMSKDMERFKTSLKDKINPEPGRYSLENLGVTETGIVPKNGYRSVVQQKFGKADRNGLYGKIDSYPGPGTYKSYSEFG